MPTEIKPAKYKGYYVQGNITRFENMLMLVLITWWNFCNFEDSSDYIFLVDLYLLQCEINGLTSTVGLTVVTGRRNV